MRSPIFIGVCLSLIASPAASETDRALTLEERVWAQRAIETVYQEQQVEPAPRPSPGGQQIADDILRAKVQDYMAKSAALEELWSRPVTPGLLKAEMHLLAAETSASQLQELYDALSNRRLLIEECLARPRLVDRLIRQEYAFDPRLHAELRNQVEKELQLHGTVGRMERLGGEHRITEVIENCECTEGELRIGPDQRIEMAPEDWRRFLEDLVGQFGIRAASVDAEVLLQRLPTGRFSAIAEDESSFSVRAVLDKGEHTVRIAEVSWPKPIFDDWWRTMRGEIDP